MTHDLDTERMAQAFRTVLSEGAPEGEGKRTILVKRIPIICNDILQMKGDLTWIKWGLMAILGGVGLLALKQLGI